MGKGFTQIEGVNMKSFFFSYAENCLYIHLFLTLVVYLDLELSQINIKATFLNGNLEEEIYMD